MRIGRGTWRSSAPPSPRWKPKYWRGFPLFGNPVGVNLTELDGTLEAGPEVAQTIVTRFTNVPSTRQSGVYLALTPKGKRTAGHLLWKDADLNIPILREAKAEFCTITAKPCFNPLGKEIPLGREFGNSGLNRKLMGIRH